MFGTWVYTGKAGKISSGSDIILSLYQLELAHKVQDGAGCQGLTVELQGLCEPEE